MPAGDRRNGHARGSTAAPDHPGPGPVGPAAADRRTATSTNDGWSGTTSWSTGRSRDADNVDSTRNDDVAIVVDGTVLWSEDLDPANAVDRVGLEATVGLGSAAPRRTRRGPARRPQTSAGCRR